MAINDNYLEIKKRDDLMLTSSFNKENEQFHNKCVCFVKPNQPLQAVFRTIKNILNESANKEDHLHIEQL